MQGISYSYILLGVIILINQNALGTSRYMKLLENQS